MLWTVHLVPKGPKYNLSLCKERRSVLFFRPSGDVKIFCSLYFRTVRSPSLSLVLFIRMFRQHIQQVNFWGVSGRVHFNNGDRLSNILIKQKFPSRAVAIGQFIHANEPNVSVVGSLEWDPDRITWATGQIPSDLLPGKAHVSNLQSA